MILGFNHNVNYKGEVFHVQTEDSGVASPNITTLLYKGGVILCSKKTSYADIVKMKDFEAVVEELMKEQHKEIMRRLKAGEFDDRAFPAPAPAAAPAAVSLEVPAPLPEAEQPESPAVAAPAEEAPGAAIARMIRAAIGREISRQAAVNKPLSLDDAVSEYLASIR